MSLRACLLAAGAAGVVASASLAGPNSFLIVPDWTGDRVVALSAFDGSLINADFIQGAGTLLSPKNAVSSGRGSILVSDQLADSITEWGFDGSFLGTLVQGGTGGPVDNLRGMTVRDNFMYVTVGSGSAAGTVQRFELDGANQTTFATTGGSPFDIFFYGDEALVSNSTTNRIDRFDMSGNLLGSFAAPGTSFPQQINERANGNLLVATFSGASSGIYEFDSNYNLVDSYALALGLRGVHELGNGNLLFTNGSAIFTLDTATGQTSEVFSGGNFQYIELAVIPAPGGAGVLALAGLAASRRRRR